MGWFSGLGYFTGATAWDLREGIKEIRTTNDLKSEARNKYIAIYSYTLYTIHYCPGRTKKSQYPSRYVKEITTYTIIDKFCVCGHHINNLDWKRPFSGPLFTVFIVLWSICSPHQILRKE